MRKIDYSLLNKLKERKQSIVNDNQPKMSIQLSRAKNTIQDSSYWTTETIRTGTNLGESSVAARRLTTHGSPDGLYNVYVQNGIVKTAYRPYPDYEELKWLDQFEVGPGSSVAIAFDGYWDLYREKWRIISSEKPWIFWVDNGSLYRQYWDETETRDILATQVKNVKAIRAWRNINIIGEDQGLVVGYTKNDSKLYYRNLAEQLDLEIGWEQEREVEGFNDVKTFNIFLTNDYRLGFIAESSKGVSKLMITERAWAGMAIRPEYVAVKPGDVEVDLTWIEKKKLIVEDENLSVSSGDVLVNLLHSGKTNYVREMINKPVTMINNEGEEYEDWGYKIEVEFGYGFTNLSVEQVTLADKLTSLPIPIESIDKVSDRVYIVNISRETRDGMNVIEGEAILSISNSVNPAGGAYDELLAEFTPVNLVYPTTIYPPPEVEVIWNE